MARLGGREQSEAMLEQFLQKLQALEPMNVELHLFHARLISRICSEYHSVI